MTGHRSAGTVRIATGRVCTACPLLCDDIGLDAADRGPANACDTGVAAFAAAAGGSRPADGLKRPLDRAAELAIAARRVLVTGLADATNEAIVAACDLAETLAAAIDADAPETSRVAGPTIARVGEVTADWEELRDRADLVVFWFHDPSATHPRFLERFVAPAPAGAGGRRTIAVGPAAVLPPGPTHVHVPLPASAAVDAARLLHARLRRSAIGAAQPAPASAGIEEAVALIAAAIAASGCVALITGPGDDPIGVEPWALAGLVREIAHVRPAFAVPLGVGVHGAGANAAGVIAICTWRYGAGGAIGRADRHGGEFLPAEADARRLIDRGEIDCVIAVGRLSATVEAAIAARAGLSVIRVAAAAALRSPPRPAAPADVWIPCANLLVNPGGSMLRGDGRRVVLGPVDAGSDSMAAVLTLLRERIVAGGAAGGGR